MLSIKTIAPFEFEAVNSDIPEVSDDEVLVKMLQVGICASDVQVYHGKHKYMSYPVVQGHEGIGIVEKTGKNISHVKPGEKVIIQPQLICGECYACRKGRHNVCEKLRGMGIKADGMFAEYLVSPSWNVIKVPIDLSNDMGMLVEPAAICVNSIRQGKVKSGDRVIIIGAGTIGNIIGQIAKSIGAEVLITDIADDKLKIAEKCGIDYCVNTLKYDLKKEIARCFKGNNADAIFDCAAVKESLPQAIDCAANASTIIIVGNFKEPITLEIPSLQRREIALISVMGNVRENFIEAIELLSKNKINISEIISARFPLHYLKKAFEFNDENASKVMKIAIMMDN